MRGCRLAVLILAGVMLAGCLTMSGQGNNEEKANSPVEVMEEPMELPDLGMAPELVNDIWLNTPEPLRLADLRGQVVLLEFWTFG